MQRWLPVRVAVPGWRNLIADIWRKKAQQVVAKPKVHQPLEFRVYLCFVIDYNQNKTLHYPDHYVINPIAP